MVEGGLRRPGRRTAPQPLHGRHRRRRQPHQPAGRPGVLDRRRRTCAPSSTGSGSDGTVGANKNTVKIVGEEHGPLRPGLLRLRLEEVGLDDGRRTCASARRRSARTYLIERADVRRPATSSASSSGWTSLGVADPGATVPAEQPVRPRRGLGPPARRGAAGDPRAGPGVWLDRRVRAWRRDAGLGGRINTVMQTCFFALSGVLPRERGHRRASRTRSRRPTASGDERSCERNFAGDRRGARRAPAGAPSPVEATSAIRRRPPVPGRGARLRPAGHRDDARGRGRPAAGERPAGGRHVPHGDLTVGEARHRPRDPDLGSVDLHRLRQVRDRLPARRHPDEGLRARGR